MSEAFEGDEQRLRAMLGAVAEAFGVDGDVVITEDPEGGFAASIDGEGADGLVGRNGEVIDAIQYIASQVVGRGESGRRRVGVDAGGYRARREAVLIELAGRAADEAVKFGEDIELDAMTPHDRRIVHMALKDRTDVATRSEGEEPRRRIVVEPAQ